MDYKRSSKTAEAFNVHRLKAPCTYSFELYIQQKSLHVIILSDGLQGNAHLLYLGPVMISYRSRGFNNNVLTSIKKINSQI